MTVQIGGRTKIWLFFLVSSISCGFYYISGPTNFNLFNQNIVRPANAVGNSLRVPFPTAVLQFYNLCKSHGVQLVVMDTVLLEAVIRKTAVNWTGVVMVTYGAFQEQQQILSEVVNMSLVQELGLTASVMEVPLPEFHAAENSTSPGLCFLLRFNGTTSAVQIMIIQKHKHFYTTGSYIWNVGKERNLTSQPLIMETFATKEVELSGTIMQVPEATNQFLAELPVMKFIPCNGSVMTPLVNEKNSNYLRSLLHMSSLAYKLGKPLVLFGGTLLGWYRECSILSHTTDVDTAMFIDDYDEQLQHNLQSDGQVSGSIYGKISEGLQYQVRIFGIQVDIFFAYNKTGNHSFWFQEIEPSSLTKLRLTYPEFSVCSAHLLDHVVRVPCPVVPVLEAEYGPGWTTPVKDWNYMSSPKNSIKFGTWDKSDRPNVVRNLNLGPVR